MSPDRISPALVARLAAQLFRRAARPCHTPAGAVRVGPYWSSSAQEAYHDIARSYRIARSGRLHGGAGPYGARGPAAWEGRP